MSIMLSATMLLLDELPSSRIQLRTTPVVVTEQTFPTTVAELELSISHCPAAPLLVDDPLVNRLPMIAFLDPFAWTPALPTPSKVQPMTRVPEELSICTPVCPPTNTQLVITCNPADWSWIAE